MTRATTKAPAYADLPVAKPRTARGGPELRELRVRLEVVTPILGGSYQIRAIDEVDVIRAASVRGHLRFWWRALYASQYLSTKEPYAEELCRRESALWGRAATDDGGRSAVEIRVDVDGTGDIDYSDINLQQTPGAYALWPARAERKPGQEKPTAPRRKPGTQFQLMLKVAATTEAEVRNALRAWILFGGYGGRTRRGLGSLKVLEDVSAWLPSAATPDALTSLFGFDIFVAPTKKPGDVPSFGRVAIYIGRADRNAQTAWTTALGWLQEFRQGINGAGREIGHEGLVLTRGGPRSRTGPGGRQSSAAFKAQESTSVGASAAPQRDSCVATRGLRPPHQRPVPRQELRTASNSKKE